MIINADKNNIKKLNFFQGRDDYNEKKIIWND